MLTNGCKNVVVHDMKALQDGGNDVLFPVTQIENVRIYDDPTNPSSFNTLDNYLSTVKPYTYQHTIYSSAWVVEGSHYIATIDTTGVVDVPVGSVVNLSLALRSTVTKTVFDNNIYGLDVLTDNTITVYSRCLPQNNLTVFVQVVGNSNTELNSTLNINSILNRANDSVNDTLYANAWVFDTATGRYTQNIELLGANNNDDYLVDLSSQRLSLKSVSEAELIIEGWNCVYTSKIPQAGRITFFAFTQPSADIPISIRRL